MTMYLVKKWEPKPKPVEVEKMTEKSVWVNGRRSAKVSEWDRYFPSFSEALQFMINREEKKMDYHKRKAHESSSTLGQLRSLTS